mmetsp:Transcript_20492/g.19473  ORF Transcript_20492/g.19473 Transcript_20492/m.19473 type:complete len:213 (+) Transcript_20492:1058-1696(+)
MTDQGFQVDIRLDRQTGFLLGGNEHNCGTWMDKMGSSFETGNRGKPATPRDGAPIELVALLYSSLQFVIALQKEGHFDHREVELEGGSKLSFEEWADLVKNNFERHFWVPQDSSEDQEYKVEKKLINRRGIYKDVYLSTHQYTDYQLRSNLCVAMSYAPDLFNREHAVFCLKQVEAILVEKNCMGIKSLDPADKKYNGDYVGSDKTNGWNYH